jgi:hypothetical protein
MEETYSTKEKCKNVHEPSIGEHEGKPHLETSHKWEANIKDENKSSI